jgi:hypothetical protein
MLKSLSVAERCSRGHTSGTVISWKAYSLRLRLLQLWMKGYNWNWSLRWLELRMKLEAKSIK